MLIKNEKDYEAKNICWGNSTATIYIPAINQAKIREGGKRLDKVSGMKFIKLENNMAVY